MHDLEIMKKLIAGILATVFSAGVLGACYVDHPHPYYSSSYYHRHYHRTYYRPGYYY